MKKIIIISATDTLKNLCADIAAQTADEYELHTSHDGQEAAALIARSDGDLIVYDLASAPESQTDDLVTLTERFPSIPCIAIVDEEGDAAESAMAARVSRCLSGLPSAGVLLRHIKEQLQLSASSLLQGFSLPGLLQLLKNERKTCTLQIKSRGRTGLLFCQGGRVVAARAGEMVKERALHALSGWKEVTVQIRFFNGHLGQHSDSLLATPEAESFPAEDQWLRPEPEQTIARHLPPEAGDNSTLLDTGIKVTMEFDLPEPPLTGTMVGGLAEEYLIVTIPIPPADTRAYLQAGGRIEVNAFHRDRLCTFTSQVLQTGEAPRGQCLLFLRFPPTVSYQELHQAKRTAIFVPCTLHPPREPELYGVLIDLSGRGCLCQLKARTNAVMPPLAIGAKIRLRCLLPGLKEDQEIVVIIKDLQKREDETCIEMEFVSLQDYLSEAIANYIYTFANLPGQQPSCRVEDVGSLMDS
ncbi:MAG: DUF4388 domain-containing protein [Desulfopila sp.]